jgi:hypothetical protein
MGSWPLRKAKQDKTKQNKKTNPKLGLEIGVRIFA